MISVIMPVYNAARFLREAIESVLSQTEGRFELIIVNDGSTDESEEIILSYDDKRIKYIKKERGGVASARNLGLDYAVGEFVVWHDADDVSLPVRLEHLRRALLSYDVSFAHSDLLLIDEYGCPIGYWQASQLEPKRLLRFLLKVGTPFNNPSMMVRRDVLGRCLFDNELIIGEDTDILDKFFAGVGGVHIPEPLLLYRRHSSNLTRSRSYGELFAHVRKFLERHSLQELVPEVDWSGGTPSASEARARAIVALFLWRRGMVLDAEQWFEKARELATDPDVEKFVQALEDLAGKNFRHAGELLEAIGRRDHLVENYLGEVYAYMGDHAKAFKHFLTALHMDPDYDEPLDNLRALGARQGLNLIDPTLRKFL